MRSSRAFQCILGLLLFVEVVFGQPHLNVKRFLKHQHGSNRKQIVVDGVTTVFSTSAADIANANVDANGSTNTVDAAVQASYVSGVNVNQIISDANAVSGAQDTMINQITSDIQAAMSQTNAIAQNTLAAVSSAPAVYANSSYVETQSSSSNAQFVSSSFDASTYLEPSSTYSSVLTDSIESSDELSSIFSSATDDIYTVVPTYTTEPIILPTSDPFESSQTNAVSSTSVYVPDVVSVSSSYSSSTTVLQPVTTANSEAPTPVTTDTYSTSIWTPIVPTTAAQTSSLVIVGPQPWTSSSLSSSLTPAVPFSSSSKWISGNNPVISSAVSSTVLSSSTVSAIPSISSAVPFGSSVTSNISAAISSSIAVSSSSILTSASSASATKASASLSVSIASTTTISSSSSSSNTPSSTSSIYTVEVTSSSSRATSNLLSSQSSSIVSTSSKEIETTINGTTSSLNHKIPDVTETSTLSSILSDIKSVSSHATYTTDATITSSTATAKESNAQVTTSEVTSLYFSSSSSSSLVGSTAISTSETVFQNGTRTDSNWWVPTSLVTNLPTETGTAVETATGTRNIPQAIAAPTQGPSPEGYTLITVGFKKALNFDFVISSSVTAAQIFAFLPVALKAPFGDKADQTNVVRLIAWNNAKFDYTVTIAEVYFPTSLVSSLQKMIKAGSKSDLVKDNDGIDLDLILLIEPNISLTSLLNSNSNSSGGNGSGSSNSNNGDDSDSSSSDIGTLDFSSKATTNKSISTKEKGKLTGLIIGVVIGSAAYFMCMILLVRYMVNIYRNRKLQKLGLDNSDASTISSSSMNSIYGEKLNGQHKLYSDYDATDNVRNNRDSITPSEIITKWMDNKDYETSDNNNTEKNNSKGKIKISKPIATQNSLGWDEFQFVQ